MQTNDSWRRWRGRAAALSLVLVLGAAPLGFGAGADEELAGQTAELSWEGLSVIAVAERWEFAPVDLTRTHVPILVTITNEGDAPVEIDLTDFVLVDGQGEIRPAISPYKIVGGLGLAPATPDTPVRMATDAPDAEQQMLFLAADGGGLLARAGKKKTKSSVKAKSKTKARPAARSRPAVRSQPRSAPRTRVVPRPATRQPVRTNRPGLRPGHSLSPRDRGGRTIRHQPVRDRRPEVEMRTKRRTQYRELRRWNRDGSDGSRGDGHGRGGERGHRGHRGQGHHSRHYHHHHHHVVRLGVPLWWWGCHPYWGCFDPYGYHYHVYTRYYVSAGEPEAEDEEPGQAVLDLALQEGVLDPGRKVSGFVFFERPSEPGPLNLRWEVWGEDGELPLATLDLFLKRG